MMSWYNNGDMSAGGWITMMVILSLFWGLVLLVGVTILRDTGNRDVDDLTPAERAGHCDSVDIVDERFARGELGREEYETRNAVLRGNNR